jgi:DNA ligase (NAD+)
VIAKLVARGVNMTEPGRPARVTPVDPDVPADADDGAPATASMTIWPLQRADGTPMTVVVTGAVPGLSRNEGNEAVERLGGKSSSSVSKRTDLVVIGDGAGSKAKKAEELGVRILPAEQFAAMLAAHVAGQAEVAARILA